MVYFCFDWEWLFNSASRQFWPWSQPIQLRMKHVHFLKKSVCHSLSFNSYWVDAGKKNWETCREEEKKGGETRVHWWLTHHSFVSLVQNMTKTWLAPSSALASPRDVHYSCTNVCTDGGPAFTYTNIFLKIFYIISSSWSYMKVNNSKTLSMSVTNITVIPAKGLRILPLGIITSFFVYTPSAPFTSQNRPVLTKATGKHA